MSPFDFVNSINSGKDVMTDADNPELMESDYKPWLINKAFSYYRDTIFYANEINLHQELDSKLQYFYLLNSIRPSKRFAKWVKKQDSNDLEIVKMYYGYNDEKAAQALDILSKEQLHNIKIKIHSIKEEKQKVDE